MSINSFYRWRNELQRIGVGTAGEDGAEPVASTATARRAASATARTPLTADPLVATLRTELQRTAKMRAALGEIRGILQETLRA